MGPRDGETRAGRRGGVGDHGPGQPASRVRVALGRDGDRLALVVDGVVQSVSLEGTTPLDGYWRAMVPDVRPERALILGLGGGTIARLLSERFGDVPIVGVERDPEVVALARAHFGLDRPGLTVVLADALEYVATCRQAFDLICVDLYDGSSLARGVLGKPFLRQVRALLRPGGLVLLNLMLGRRLPQQLHRLARVFRVVATDQQGLNLVVHLKA